MNVVGTMFFKDKKLLIDKPKKEFVSYDRSIIGMDEDLLIAKEADKIKKLVPYNERYKYFK